MDRKTGEESIMFIPLDADKSVRLLKWRKLEVGELDKEGCRQFGKFLPSPPSLPLPMDDYAKTLDKNDSTNQSKASTPSFYHRYAGICFGLLAAASFSTSSLTAKLLAGKKYHTFNIALWKYQGMTIFGPIILWYFACVRKTPVLETIWPLTRPNNLRVVFFLVLRGTVGLSTMCLQTQSLRYLTLADSSLIAFSTPIAVTFFARVFLHEPCGIVSFIIAVTTFLGVCILARPPILTGGEDFDLNVLIGISYAFGAMLFLSSVFIIIRLIREAHFSLFICFYGYLGSIETLTLAYTFGVFELPRTQLDYVYAGGSAILSLCGQFFLTMALQADFAGLVSLVRTGDVVFAFIWQIILGSIPDMFSFIGAFIIITCIVTTGFNKWLASLPDDHKIRKRFWVLLK